MFGFDHTATATLWFHQRPDFGSEILCEATSRWPLMAAGCLVTPVCYSEQVCIPTAKGPFEVALAANIELIDHAGHDTQGNSCTSPAAT